MFNKKVKEVEVEEPKKTKRQQVKEIKDLTAKFMRANVKQPYVKVMRNGVCLNPITRANPYLFTALPTAFLSPRGSKYHK